MANELKNIKSIKRKVEEASVRLHFLAKNYQKQLNQIPVGSTIGGKGQELAQKIMATLNAADYCAYILNELEKIPPYGVSDAGRSFLFSYTSF